MSPFAACCRDRRAATLAPEISSASARSSRCVPKPTGSRSWLPHSGHAAGSVAACPQWWQRKHRSRRGARRRRALQRGHIAFQPQAAHSSDGAKPRRLMNSSACSRFARRSAIARCKRRRDAFDVARWPGSAPAARWAAHVCAVARAAEASATDIGRASPARSFPSEGVALPRMIGTPRSCARKIATSRA